MHCEVLSLFLGTLLTGLAACGEVAPDCQSPVDLKLIRLRGPDAEQTMTELCVMYPDGIEGGLFVEETRLKTLDLPCLCALSGSLIIRDNPELVDLEGLAHVDRLDGSLWILENPALTSLVGLPTRATLSDLQGTSLEIRDNDALVDLNGLPEFSDSPGRLLILDNDALIRLHGLPASLPRAGALQIAANPALLDLSGLPPDLRIVDGDLSVSMSQSRGYARELPRTLTSVGNNLRLAGFTSLAEFPPGLVAVGGDLQIENNPSLVSLTGLPEGLAVAGSLSITSNPTLTDLSGLPGVLEIGGRLTLGNNDGLVDLSGLPDEFRVGIDEQNGVSLAIENNPGLEHLSGLPMALTAVPGSVEIRGNPKLRDLTGLFDSLRSIGGELVIADNPGLLDLTGFAEGTTLGIGVFGPSLRIEGNARLERLVGLPASLTTLAGGLSLVDNPALVDLTGLEALRQVQGDLLIGRRLRNDLGNPCDWSLVPAGNAGLQSLAGLAALSDVGGAFAIACHPNLVDLASLSQLTTVAEALLLLDNPALVQLGGLGDALETVGAYQVRCSPDLDPDAAAAVIAGVTQTIPTSIELTCD